MWVVSSLVNGERKLSYDDFLWGVDLISESKGVSFDEVAGQILDSGGPASSGGGGRQLTPHTHKRKEKRKKNCIEPSLTHSPQTSFDRMQHVHIILRLL